jgi:hypothetical protein
LNSNDFAPRELEVRIRQVCAHYVIEAKVDVERLLRHPEWTVRNGALDIVWWGLGATDGIGTAIDLLFHDPEEEVRVMAALALYEASRGTAKQEQAVAASSPSCKAKPTNTCAKLPSHI